MRAETRETSTCIETNLQRFASRREIFQNEIQNFTDRSFRGSELLAEVFRDVPWKFWPNRRKEAEQFPSRWSFLSSTIGSPCLPALLSKRQVIPPEGAIKYCRTVYRRISFETGERTRSTRNTIVPCICQDSERSFVLLFTALARRHVGK